MPWSYCPNPSKGGSENVNVNTQTDKIESTFLNENLHFWSHELSPFQIICIRIKASMTVKNKDAMPTKKENRFYLDLRWLYIMKIIFRNNDLRINLSSCKRILRICKILLLISFLQENFRYYPWKLRQKK